MWKRRRWQGIPLHYQYFSFNNSGYVENLHMVDIAVRVSCEGSIRKKMFVSENIVSMDNRSIQRFIRKCDVKDIAYALKGSDQKNQ